MKAAGVYLVCLLAALVLPRFAISADAEAPPLVLTPEQIERCRQERCVLVTESQLHEALVKLAATSVAPVFDEGFEQGARTCKRQRI